ncbi:putative Amino acid or sugar ABC transport system, permease protein [Mesorhizobium plurifarium]|uniref:Putative Amino acid or sugar ABC transport system, permease protein n=1 Tax=Mesorhizobium plurifarium TaxID=69974 RepID=A0A090F1D6_MESPL|nr:putative Amino acid or sugar ABC transport system, permease protein [Mesorhizobium sp. SOD10]CDX35317.1 putative Amino acid or sugar ABC transport system, permease protein [Mesorhizobium plurifarium]
MEWISTLLQGLLLGGVYSLFAIGLSLVFGVMRLVNIAHGDLIVLASFTSYVVVQALGVGPLMSLVIVLPTFFLFGYLVQLLVLNRTLGDDMLPPMIVTFGLSIVIQNALFDVFTADNRKLNLGPIETASFRLGNDIAIGIYPLAVFAIAIATIVALQALFYNTKLGREFRATSDDAEAARMMGINTKRVFAVATGIGMVVIAIAGVLMGVRTTFDPFSGPVRLLFAFEAVIIGGLGSIWGTLFGGIVLGLAQAIGGQIDPQFQIMTGHIVFLVVLLLRPTGFFPKVQH